LDVTSSFLRDENFQTRDELIKWVFWSNDMYPAIWPQLHLVESAMYPWRYTSAAAPQFHLWTSVRSSETCARLSLPSLDLPTFSSISTKTEKIGINTNARKYGKSKLKHIHAYQTKSTNSQTVQNHNRITNYFHSIILPNTWSTKSQTLCPYSN
jgi:hypothetical protein